MDGYGPDHRRFNHSMDKCTTDRHYKHYKLVKQKLTININKQTGKQQQLK